MKKIYLFIVLFLSNAYSMDQFRNDNGNEANPGNNIAQNGAVILGHDVDVPAYGGFLPDWRSKHPGTYKLPAYNLTDKCIIKFDGDKYPDISSESTEDSEES